MILFRQESPLYTRIMASIMLASVFFLTLLSVIVYYTNEVLEYDFLARQTNSELRNIQHLLAQDPQAPLPKSASVDIYLASRQPGQPIPVHLLELPNGEYHNVVLGGYAYHILITEHAGDRIYIQYDITEIERSEEILAIVLIVGWVSMIVILYFIARFLSRRLSDPVTQLSRELDSINPDQRGVRLGGQFEDDEVGKIAQSFDSYTRKMDDYVEKQIAFTTMASHELRTPLSVVQTSADLIACRQEDSRVAGHLDKIQRASKHMADTIHSLLAITRERPTCHSGERFRLGPQVDEIIATKQAEILTRGIEVNNCLDHELELEADKTLVNVVLSNLIGNAIKYGQKSQLKIEISANTLIITDNGRAIDHEKLSHIFDFDYQSESDSIGFYISKLICDHQGWFLNMEQNDRECRTSNIEFPALIIKRANKDQ